MRLASKDGDIVRLGGEVVRDVLLLALLVEDVVQVVVGVGLLNEQRRR